MEPQLPSPNFGADRNASTPERRLETAETIPTPDAIGERQETRETQPAPPADPAPRVSPVVPVLPQMTSAPAATPGKAPQDDDTPATAADEDLIEKEWVEKAKKVIAETKHDPYLQEQAVSRLQADYLQKRYSKTVKLPNEGA